jgi:hypothetical protein
MQMSQNNIRIEGTIPYYELFNKNMMDILRTIEEIADNIKNVLITN